MQQTSSVPGVPAIWAPTVKWLFVFGEPGVSIPGYSGGLITWVKVVGLFALLAWVLSWVVATFRARKKDRADWLDVVALVALLGSVGAVVLNVLQNTGRLKSSTILGGYSVATMVALACGSVILVWVERALWTAIARLGKASDAVVGVGVHLGVLLGVGVAYLVLGAQSAQPGSNVPGPVNLGVAISSGVRLGATYMGFVVLAKVLWLLVPEILAMRFRRLFSIAWLSVIESTRRMWAPWVVIVVFLVILAFTHWFLPVQRPAELGRILVGTLALLCMLLLTVMVTVLSPLSLPQDIQAQTIYTVVSKPVRRLELIWGRMIGYMTIVTALVLLFGAVSLIYLQRNIGGTIRNIEDQAEAVRQTDPDRARYLDDQAEQLRTRMSARVPVKGSLTFIDSRGNPTLKGIDVGQELEYRSHVEGGTPSAAIWKYGVVDDPYDPKIKLDKRIPVDSLLISGTIEEIENRAFVLDYGIAALQRRGQQPNVPAAEVAKIDAEVAKTREEAKKLRDDSKKLQDEDARLRAEAKKADTAKNPEESERLLREASALHSPPIPIEMTFTIYRTTKGRVGDPVYAELEVENPRTNQPKFRDTFPIREYYTNKRLLPSSFLVGSLGSLVVTVHCMSPTQYLGMAESDFYLLADEGNFGQNFMKGLFGIWLQAMVLTAIGVFAGTFLSWPVALLFTIAFFVAGHAAQALLRDFVLQSIVGGGPFESLIRLVSHENLVSDIAPTLGVVVAKTFDAILMPVLSRMAYLIPNLSSLDVSNSVAEGFAVGGPLMLNNSLIALAYALPFSIAGYFILKNREVAA